MGPFTKGFDMRNIATIAIDFAPYPKEHPGRKRQHRCILTNLQNAPHDFRIQLGSVNSSRGSIVSWPRNGRSTHSEKAVPFVRDLLDWATAQNSVFGGFVNSDIILHPNFFEQVRELSTRCVDCVLVHRTDVTEAELDEFLKTDNAGELIRGKKVEPTRSIDGVFFRRDAWMLVRETLPDFVIAEPFWDTSMIHLATHAPFETAALTSHEALHVRHATTWSFGSVGGMIAKKMHERFLSSWP